MHCFDFPHCYFFARVGSCTEIFLSIPPFFWHIRLLYFCVAVCPTLFYSSTLFDFIHCTNSKITFSFHSHSNSLSDSLSQSSCHRICSAHSSILLRDGCTTLCCSSNCHFIHCVYRHKIQTKSKNTRRKTKTLHVNPCLRCCGTLVPNVLHRTFLLSVSISFQRTALETAVPSDLRRHVN